MILSELADELGTTTVTVVAACEALGIEARWAGAELTDEEAERVRRSGPAAAEPRPFGSAAPLPPGSNTPIQPPAFGAAPPAAFGAAPPAGSTGPGRYNPDPPPGFVPQVSGFAQPLSAPSQPAAAAFGPPPAVGMGAPPAVGMGPPTTADEWTPNPAADRPATRLAATPLPAARGRRDTMVATGWKYWWRSIEITVATWVIGVIVALVMGATAPIEAAYDYKDSSGPGAKIAFVLFVFLAGFCWATESLIRAAVSAVDGWNRIAESDGALKGRPSIVFMVYAAVAGCVCIVLWIIAGSWLVIAVG